mgnify:CR=1 FL=1
MKKIFVSIVMLFVIIILSFVMFNTENQADCTQCLRIHIRANSNGKADQTVKYKVRTAVIEYLTPYLAEATDKLKAQSVIACHLTSLNRLAENVLIANGFDYGASAKMTQENFPTRSYDGLVLKSGIYDALIIDLGSGQGDNWWCVVYPPLCFINAESTGGNSIEYVSKIKEIIENFKRKHG